MHADVMECVDLNMTYIDFETTIELTGIKLYRYDSLAKTEERKK